MGVGVEIRKSLTRTDSGSADSPGDGGGNVEDILKRLGNLETGFHELKSQVSAILAAKADLMDVRAYLSGSVADVRASVADVRASLAAMETAIIKWSVATMLATGALAFTIAKFVH